MSITLEASHCPRCGSTKPTVFIRSDDGQDLVCLAEPCRRGSTALAAADDRPQGRPPNPPLSWARSQRVR